MKKEDLLDYLIKQDDYISGSSLASIYGVSRNAIWKMVRQLEDDGIKIDSKPNKGYKIDKSINFINKAVLEQLINDDFYKIIVFKEIPSSNTYLKQNLDLEDGTVVFARSQTAGRGILDRTFYSPIDTGLYFSILVKPKTVATSSVYLTVLSAVACLEGIKEALGINVDIKWVNDLYKDGKKIAGILAEGTVNIDLNTLDKCIIGIGINVLRPTDGFNSEIKDIATYLIDKQDENLNYLAACILKAFKKHYLEYLNGDYRFKDTYIANQFLIGKDVESVNLATNEKRIVKVLKINDDCSLMVIDKDGNSFNINSGEVRLLLNN